MSELKHSKVRIVLYICFSFAERILSYVNESNYFKSNCHEDFVPTTSNIFGGSNFFSSDIESISILLNFASERNGENDDRDEGERARISFQPSLIFLCTD